MHEKWETFFVAALTGASVDTDGQFQAETIVNAAVAIADAACKVYDERRTKVEKEG